MSDFNVAVVIPLFNKAPFIRATLQSVLAQTLVPTEVLIIDDQSTDGSSDAIADLIGGPVRLIRQANAGPGPARTGGAAEASAEWIALIDGDDLWGPDHLATLAAVASAVPQADVIATDYSEGERAAGPDALRCAVERPAPRPINFFAESEGRSRLWTSATAIRRSVLVSSGGFGAFFPGEDIELWVRLALDHPIAVTDARTAYYVRDTGGLAEQSQDEAGSDIVLGPLFDMLDARICDPLYAASRASLERFRANYLKSYVRSALYRRNPAMARELVAMSRRHGATGLALLDLLSRLPRRLLELLFSLRGAMR